MNKMWIDGIWTDSVGGECFDLINPSTREIIGCVPAGVSADVNLAIQAARRAFPTWSKTSHTERSAQVSHIASALSQYASEFGHLEALNRGTPVRYSVQGFVDTSARIREIVHSSSSVLNESSHYGQKVPYIVDRTPVGVCAIVNAWNVSFRTMVQRIASSIVLGNTCVLTPTPSDSLSALRFAEILEGLKVPPGVVNIVTAADREVGSTLLDSAEVNLISFTGSKDTAKMIFSDRLRNSPVHLALHIEGPLPYIVLDDADIDQVIKRTTFTFFGDSSIVWAYPARFYVHESIYENFTHQLFTAAKNIVVGNPLDETTQMGPAINATHQDMVEESIRFAMKNNATRYSAGTRPCTPPLDRGFFVEPTLLTNIKPGFIMATQEIFGPLACVSSISSDDEAIKLGRYPEFGFSTSIWSRDLLRAARIGDTLGVRMTFINNCIVPTRLEREGGAVDWQYESFPSFPPGAGDVTEELVQYTQIRAKAIDITSTISKGYVNNN